MSRGSELAKVIPHILTALYSHEDDVAIREIADECGIPKSTLHRILQMLEDEGWVYQGEDNRYRIGLRLLVLASQSRLRMELVRQLNPIMKHISAFCGQTVILNVLDERESVCLHTIGSKKRIKIDSQIGARGPLHAGASGKVLLAFSNSEIIEEVLTEPLKSFTPLTITDPEDMKQEIKKILKNRYAVSIEELDPGAAAIAVPILDTHGELIAGISIAGPRFDFEGRVNEWALEMLRVTESVLDCDAKKEGSADLPR